MKNIKTITLCSIALFYAALGFANNKLNMFIDYNRFLDKDKNTILLIDYQIPYRNLVFIAQHGGYFAEVDVKVELVHGDSVVISQQITDNVGVSNKADTDSKGKNYLNRLSFTLDKPLDTVRFIATDINAERVFNWQFPIERLSPATILSDLELNSEVKPDTLQHLPKFKRSNTLYRSEPSFFIDRDKSDYAYLYLESYQSVDGSKGSNMLNLYLEKDSLSVMDEYFDYTPKNATESFTLKIPIKDLELGRYNGSVTLQTEEHAESRNFEFVLIEEAEELHFIFADPEDEYMLMRIFLGNQMPTDWKNFDTGKKRRYSTQFWKNMAVGTKRSVEDIMKLVHERIDYSNRYFKHLGIGWKSEMGRIYIRNGAPDDIERDTTSDTGRFVRKDYQIWKYQSGLKPVYIFVDIQMNGNYRLIYVENDDMENSDPDWRRFLGSDFDESDLDN